MDEETREVVPLESNVPALPMEELAGKVIEVMDRIEEGMKLETPHPSTRSRVNGARTIPRPFVVAVIAAMESTPEFQKFGAFDLAEAREVLEADDSYRVVAERTTRLLASMKYTIEARWAKVAEAAMQSFTLASIMAEDPRETKLAAVVESLRKILGRKGRKKKKKE